VNSTVLLFKPKKKLNFKIKNIKNLEKITQIFFSGKRKMINKPLKNIFGDSVEIISKLNLNLSMRPGDVSENDYYKIVYLFEKISDR
jgi:Dimethyladenosine transferase (rRNA methylation)